MTVVNELRTLFVLVRFKVSSFRGEDLASICSSLLLWLPYRLDGMKYRQNKMLGF